MAIISRIRKRGTLIIGFVGLSMLLFILGDVVTSNSGLFSGSSDVVGVVNGEKIHYREYEAKADKMIENYKANTHKDNVDANTSDMIRDQLWDNIVKENTLGKEYEKLGLSCDKDELYDMTTGKNVDPKIRQAFTDSTGNFNPQTVVRFLNDLPNRDEKLQQQWSEFEKQLQQERIDEKYKQLIKGSMFVTTSEAKAAFDDQNRSASVRFVAENYRSVPDSTVKVTEDEIEKYYDAHKQEHKQDQAVRKVEYVAFEVVPSQEDQQKAMEQVMNLKQEFRTTNDMLSFLTQNESPYDSTFHTQATLPPSLSNAISLPVDTVLGPYMEAGTIKLARITKERFQPDSVKARHILLKLEGDTAAVMARIDSMKAAAKKSKTAFEEMAKKFSTDVGSGAKGGDLGWFPPGRMVPEFNDACFNGKKGDMPIVKTQFGVHLIEITDQAKPSRQVQIPVLEYKMEPSQKTYDSYYQQASEFSAVNTTGPLFDKAATEKGLNKRIADNLKENDKNISGLDQPRELIRWAFGAKKDEVSKVFTLGNTHVVAHLVDIRDKGILPLDAVREQMTAGAKKDKKAEMLIEKFNTALKDAKTLDELAAKLNTTVKTQEMLQFANPVFPEVGRELGIGGTLLSMDAGKMSAPLKGDMVVMVAEVVKFTDAPKDADVSTLKTQKLATLKQRSEYEVPNALKEKANIVDNRGKFY
jgi:peptidyl-prolyl cis-trans isomerase D